MDLTKSERSPTVVSGYVHPLRNSYLTEALHTLMQKNAVELENWSELRNLKASSIDFS